MSVPVEDALAVSRRDGLVSVAASVHQLLRCPCGQSLQELLDLGPHGFNRVEVGRIGAADIAT